MCSIWTGKFLIGGFHSFESEELLTSANHCPPLRVIQCDWCNTKFKLTIFICKISWRVLCLVCNIYLQTRRGRVNDNGHLFLMIFHCAFTLRVIFHLQCVLPLFSKYKHSDICWKNIETFIGIFVDERCIFVHASFFHCDEWNASCYFTISISTEMLCLQAAYQVYCCTT